MEYTNNTGYELDWDSEIEQESQEFITLPAGTYPFQVIGFDRKPYEGSQKIPPCKMAVVHFAIDGGSQGTAYVNERLYLHSRMEWKLSEFFTSIGLKKKGERVAMNWNAVPGATGMVELVINKYEKNGKELTNNRIDRFLPAENSAQAPQASYPQQPPQQNTWQAPTQPQQAPAPAQATPQWNTGTWQQQGQPVPQQQTMNGFQQRERMADYQIGKF